MRSRNTSRNLSSRISGPAILGYWHNDIVANGTFSIHIYGLVQKSPWKCNVLEGCARILGHQIRPKRQESSYEVIASFRRLSLKQRSILRSRRVGSWQSGPIWPLYLQRLKKDRMQAPGAICKRWLAKINHESYWIMNHPTIRACHGSWLDLNMHGRKHSKTHPKHYGPLQIHEMNTSKCNAIPSLLECIWGTDCLQ